MNQVIRYMLLGLGTVILLLALWYFKSIVAYILISAVLSLIGRPVTEFLYRISVKGIRMPRILCAFLTLILLWAAFFTFFVVFIPLIAMQAQELSTIDVHVVTESLRGPLQAADELFRKWNLSGTEEASLQDWLTHRLVSIFNFSMITGIFNNLISFLGNLFIAFFSISFITLFFLKDQSLFKEGVMALVPTRHEEGFSHVLHSIKHLLTRYFIGICLQITGIITLITIGLSIVGFSFDRALVIGLVVGIFNVIPYLGPLIGGALGILLGVANHLDLDFYTQLLPLAGYMLIVFAATQLVDNWLFQPLIFGTSVKAHPLEIFLVIMIAGSLAGVPGMILAIPVYTVIRVFAKEFFSQYKLVKKITDKM